MWTYLQVTDVPKALSVTCLCCLSVILPTSVPWPPSYHGTDFVQKLWKLREGSVSQRGQLRNLSSCQTKTNDKCSEFVSV